MSPHGRLSGGNRVRPLPRADEVTRLEVENLYAEIAGLSRDIRRLEDDLRRMSDRLTRLERRAPVAT
jgi:hypothetical protein